MVTGVVAVDGEVTDEDLNEYCRQRLTAYKCPKSWVLVSQVPRTYVGKPDYGAIRATAMAHIGRHVP